MHTHCHSSTASAGSVSCVFAHFPLLQSACDWLQRSCATAWEVNGTWAMMSRICHVTAAATGCSGHRPTRGLWLKEHCRQNRCYAQRKYSVFGVVCTPVLWSKLGHPSCFWICFPTSCSCTLLAYAPEQQSSCYKHWKLDHCGSLAHCVSIFLFPCTRHSWQWMAGQQITSQSTVSIQNKIGIVSVQKQQDVIY